MPVFFKDNRSILFVHIPKTGGTTIERLFKTSGWEMVLRNTRKSEPQLFPKLRVSFQHWQAGLLTEILDVSKFDLIFMMTREPVARFRSEYTMRHTKNPSGASSKVDAWAEKALRAYETNPYHLDNHLRPQSEFELPDTVVYRLEDSMETMVADLNKRFDLGLAEKIPHALNSTKRSGLSSSDVEISPELDTRLRDVYAEDFRRYGY
ncbi:sulfotransferase family protein [Nocardioides sp. JQ2195]|uniref:sulfotransferase family 2 domain-containing protein n=1 Tax=Nocardioides sp. JQ2195 TaxID=2592334 RepID=UPI00143E44E9|nr:sulfotransferase family 2 domain-containing protein [Nocardioides sp. JQ2195]QIX28186.1 sulfotransferase family protein [Nocardioides sp. JQ2195]